MRKIKFGTDGWRAIIAKDFTVENVARVADASATYLLKSKKNPSVVIGFDSRFGGKLFAETAAKIFASKGIKVYIPEKFVTTPMVSLAVLNLKADLGVVITASHNTYHYNGYKLKGSHGGPLSKEETDKVEELIPDKNLNDLDEICYQNFIKENLIEITNIEGIYLEYLKKNIDIEAIRNSRFNFAFDAMYGSGQNILKTILSNVTMLHCEINPSFKNIPPEPLSRNLFELSYLIKTNKKIDCGLAVDGDADRIALYDEKGKYIDSHHIILLLIHYLAKYKGLKGKVVTGISTTLKAEKLCEHYNLDIERVKIGFKEICKKIISEDVLVGGEESGGITVKTHIPERDGIYMGLLIWTFMIETKKPLSELINEIYEITGEFGYERSDLKLPQEKIDLIIEKCKNDEFKEFGHYKIQNTEKLDGYKYFINDFEWLMIRPSGTEPVLRLYAESDNNRNAKQIIKTASKIIKAL